jgi:hypothetical protein
MPLSRADMPSRENFSVRGRMLCMGPPIEWQALQRNLKRSRPAAIRFSGMIS